MGGDSALPLLIIAIIIVLSCVGFVEFGIKIRGKNFQDESSTYQEATTVNSVVDRMLLDDVSCGETETVCNTGN